MKLPTFWLSLPLWANTGKSNSQMVIMYHG